MKVYLDTCCYGRPFDDRTQSIIDSEAIAVLTVVDMCHIVGYCIIGSDMIAVEINDIPDIALKREINDFYSDAVDVFATITIEDAIRAQTYQTVAHIKVKDSIHLVSAEAAGASVLLTTDKDFIKKAEKVNSAVKVMNPLNFKL